MRKLLLLGLGFLPIVCFSQVNISMQPPNGSLVQKDQLWNLVVVNTDATRSVIIRLAVRDALTGELLLSATTTEFNLVKGMNSVSGNRLQPIMYNSTSSFDKAYLPLGSYIACYQVSGADKDIGKPLGEECVKLDITPLSPPLLVLPENDSKISSRLPQLIWVSPTPVNLFQQLNYDLILTEVLSGQKPAEAIQQNIPVYVQHGITNQFLNYPSSATKLDSGKLYAWQITANDGLRYVAKSETWAFSVSSSDSSRSITQFAEYIELNNSNSTIYNVRGEELRLKYFSFDPEYTSNIQVSERRGKVLYTRKLKIKPGENFITVSLPRNIKGNTVYTLKLTAAHNKISKLFFTLN